jgi:hypothetical protein
VPVVRDAAGASMASTESATATTVICFMSGPLVRVVTAAPRVPPASA